MAAGTTRNSRKRTISTTKTTTRTHTTTTTTTTTNTETIPTTEDSRTEEVGAESSGNGVTTDLTGGVVVQGTMTSGAEEEVTERIGVEVTMTRGTGGVTTNGTTEREVTMVTITEGDVIRGMRGGKGQSGMRGQGDPYWGLLG